MTSISTYLRRLVPATLIAAAATLGGSAVGDPAVACVAPILNESGISGNTTCAYSKGTQAAMRRISLSCTRKCCLGSGGVWNGTECVAPPATPAQAPGRLPPGIDIQTATPVPADPGPAAPPPVVITPAP